MKRKDLLVCFDTTLISGNSCQQLDRFNHDLSPAGAGAEGVAANRQLAAPRVGGRQRIKLGGDAPGNQLGAVTPRQDSRQRAMTLRKD